LHGDLRGEPVGEQRERLGERVQIGERELLAP
jgi:hypothetical protein